MISYFLQSRTREKDYWGIGDNGLSPIQKYKKFLLGTDFALISSNHELILQINEVPTKRKDIGPRNITNTICFKATDDDSRKIICGLFSHLLTDFESTMDIWENELMRDWGDKKISDKLIMDVLNKHFAWEYKGIDIGAIKSTVCNKNEQKKYAEKIFAICNKYSDFAIINTQREYKNILVDLEKRFKINAKKNLVIILSEKITEPITLVEDSIMRKRLEKIFDPAIPIELRIFSGLEMVFFPVSLFTILVLLPLQIILSYLDFAIPVWVSCTNMVLLSAAIGYITNYIAIEMLFKPYHKSRTHFLSLITLGYWKQGLIPKNKNRIGVEMGNQIESKLLNPELLADELCDMTMGLLQSSEIMEKLRNSIQILLRDHQQKIVDFFIPQIEKSLKNSLDIVLSNNNINDFWQKEVEPFLIKKENRDIIALHISSRLQTRVPEFTDVIKSEMKNICFEYLSKKLPFGVGAETIANGLTDFIDWQDIEQRLSNKLGEESTIAMLREELQNLILQTKEWLQSPENSAKVDNFINVTKQKIHAFLHDYLSNALPDMANSIIDSPKLWDWVENDLIPSAKPQLEKLIKTEGKDKVIEKLNLKVRVADAIEKQDVKEFHNMINSIAEQHLGAIQILGYFLGLLIGLIQLLIQ